MYFSHAVFAVAFIISAVSAYYSVLGLTTIFSGAFWSIAIMGSTLEVGKIVTAMWLHRYWSLANIKYKLYLVPALIVLMALTSIGVFGLLSKAHSDQTLLSGDAGANLQLIDEKIKIQRDNIEIARKALAQMDAQVDARLSRGDSEAGAERAVQIRRSQAGERTRLTKEIAVAQAEITKLNGERAPLAAQVRKVESEVGPIKYIAALIYGDNPDTNLLERAVRWVTILIVAVFDPLAIVLILAASSSLQWERAARLQKLVEAQVPKDIPQENTGLDLEQKNPPKVEDTQFVADSAVSPVAAETEKLDGELREEQGDKLQNMENQPLVSREEIEELLKPIEVVEDSVDTTTPGGEQQTAAEVGVPNAEQDTIPAPSGAQVDIETSGVTTQTELYSDEEEYVVYDGKKISIQALKELNPSIVVHGPIVNDILFGGKFPLTAKTGDIYTRVDTVPHKTYKFNGVKWINVDREQNTSYLQNIAYIQYLISKIDTGEYDPETLTESEQEEISNYLKTTL